MAFISSLRRKIAKRRQSRDNLGHKMEQIKQARASVLSETPETLAAKLAGIGAQTFRTRQILEWIYKKNVLDFAAMTNLPQNLREQLGEMFTIVPAELVTTKQAGDTTEKLLLKLADGNHIETVILSAPEGDESEDGARMTLCVSSQVGCAFGCKFCASGLNGFVRNLDVGEIIGQALLSRAYLDTKKSAIKGTVTSIDNIVFMGMGEPLANYENVLRAIDTMHAPWGLNLGARRITISTSGIAPRIAPLADVPIQFRLAISLHGATNDVRSKIMPVNDRYPLETLIPAVKAFAEKRGRMVTLEYILIEEVNDGLDQAEALAKIAANLHAHVNLIPYNPVPGLSWKRPNVLRQNKFAEVLKKAGISRTIRRQKGDDIDAACGQLRLRIEKTTKDD
jgi:23S rRNA (adenine2503-C2)-methyltransferase